jgi:hypothetical protein
VKIFSPSQPLLIFAKRHLDQRSHRVTSPRCRMWVSHDLKDITSNHQSLIFLSQTCFFCLYSERTREKGQPSKPSGATQRLRRLGRPSMSVSQKLVRCTNPDLHGTPLTPPKTSVQPVFWHISNNRTSLGSKSTTARQRHSLLTDVNPADHLAA